MFSVKHKSIQKIFPMILTTFLAVSACSAPPPVLPDPTQGTPAPIQTPEPTQSAEAPSPTPTLATSTPTATPSPTSTATSTPGTTATSTPKSGKTAPPPVAVVTADNPSGSTDFSVDYILAELGKNFTISKIQNKDGTKVGAVEGKSFSVKGKSYELYAFDSQTALQKAQNSGKFTSGTELSVNGLFILVRPKGDSTLTSAFTSVRFQ